MTSVARIEWTPKLVREIPNGQYSKIREERVGVMLHYTGGASDEGDLSWFGHPDCRVSYHYLVLDNGDYATVAPEGKRAWHAGYCRTSDPQRLPYRDANSAFIGISAATSGSVDVTPEQMLTIAWLTRGVFKRFGWPVEEVWRIVTHSSEAVFGPGHPKEGQRGRKTDPEGGDPKNPILSVRDIRSLLPLVDVEAA